MIFHIELKNLREQAKLLYNTIGIIQWVAKDNGQKVIMYTNGGTVRNKESPLIQSRCL